MNEYNHSNNSRKAKKPYEKPTVRSESLSRAREKEATCASKTYCGRCGYLNGQGC